MRKKSAEPTGNHQGNQRVQFVLRIAIAAALGGFLFGYDTAVINGAVSAIQSTFNASAINLGLAVSSALLGSAVGALSAGWLADGIGRRRSMWLAAILFVVSALGSALAPRLMDLVAWRVIGGVELDRYATTVDAGEHTTTITAPSSAVSSSRSSAPLGGKAAAALLRLGIMPSAQSTGDAALPTTDSRSPPGSQPVSPREDEEGCVEYVPSTRAKKWLQTL